MTAPNDFDSWLEAELDKSFAQSRVASKSGIHGYQSVVARGQRSRQFLAGRPLVGKAAMAVAAATLSLGTVGAAAATAVTHSTNPQTWGQQVENAVTDCKAALKPGQHGIGECVSAFARNHESAAGARHGHGNGKKKSHAEASPGQENDAKPDTTHGHGGQPKSGKTQDSTPQGTPNGQISPSGQDSPAAP
jgi:hypothetical protein